jgi:hypothetical protein
MSSRAEHDRFKCDHALAYLLRAIHALKRNMPLAFKDPGSSKAKVFAPLFSKSGFFLL